MNDMIDCKTCKENRQKLEPVPFIVHESAMARMERSIKRLWVLALVALALLVGTNGAWLWYESQFADIVTTIEAEQETTRGSNYAVGGDLFYGTPEVEDYNP